MKKTDIYKIIAIVVVVAFVVEAIAMGVMGNNSNANGNKATPKIDIEGTTVANVTIVRYEPYLTVSGNRSGMDVAKQALIDRGDATYAILSGENMIVNLKNSKVVPSAAAEFEKLNATPYATAIIALPSNIRLQSEGIVTTVPADFSFNMRIRPVYDEGETVAASFSASIQKGQIISIGGFAFMPSMVNGARVNATVFDDPRQSHSINVPWESRNIAKEIAAMHNATYKEKSYIIIQKNASEEQLSKLLTDGKVFITNAQAGTGIVGIRNGFVDMAAANLTISATGLSPIFPPSTVNLDESSLEIAEAIILAFGEKGINATLVEKNSFAVELKENFEWGGKTYQPGSILIPLEQAGETNYTKGMRVELVLDFEAVGKRVSKIIAAKAG